MVEAEPDAFEEARAHALDDDVGSRDQRCELGAARVGLEIEREERLAAVEMQVHERQRAVVGGDDRPRHLSDVVAGRAFYFGDVRAEIDEEPSDSAGAEDRQVEHLDALEQAYRAAERGDVHDGQPGQTIDCISV